MNTNSRWVIAGMLASSLCFAKVSGKRVEKLGVEWMPTEFKNWVTRDNAVITPEISNLAVQYCLRTTQEALDGGAYESVAVKLVSAMDKQFLGKDAGKTDIDRSLAGVTRLLKAIGAINVKGGYGKAAEYQKVCQKTLATELARKENDRLLDAYEGRMNPDPIRDLPKGVSAKLEKLAKQGVALSKLTVDGLTEQVCKLEGYYSTSSDPRLWKFFSTTRVMANVLPKAANNSEFVKIVYESPEVVELIKVLNEYSSVAGRSNGPSVGMDRAALLNPGDNQIRLTGPALGSRSAALMAFYTTAWREQLQDHVIQENYPRKPFQLISAEQVLVASDRTYREVSLAVKADGRHPSQTEFGMSSVWRSLVAYHSPNVRPAFNYGDHTATFMDTSSLAWLALNAETNVRQNEKIAALERSLAVRPKAATTKIFANDSAYAMILDEIQAAEAAYKWVDPSGAQVKTTCVPGIKAFNEAAVAASKGKNHQVVEVDAGLTSIFLKSGNAYEFKPVIVDIGGEVLGDPEGLEDQHDFKLHLATGQWRMVPAKIAGKDYVLGTPSAFVIHLPKTTSTAEWQGMVRKYDTAKKEDAE